MILVVGGTGFVGKNLLVALHQVGRKVITVSRQPDQNFLSTHVPDIRSMTIMEFLSDPAAALFECHAVVYLASTSTPGANLDTIWHEAENTVAPLMRMMKSVADKSDARFIYLSSGGTVYGPCNMSLISEDTPLSPISPYGLGKKMSEAAVKFMHDSQGMQYTILRPSNPIGRWQESHSQGVVGALMRAALGGSTFPMIGSGSAVRDYFDVADLARAIIAVINAPQESAGQTWNVGSGIGLTVQEMLEMVQQVSGRKIKVVHRPARNTDVDRVVLDVSAIKDAIGWQTQLSVLETLENLSTGQD